MRALAATLALMLASPASASCFCPTCFLPGIRMFQAAATSMLPAFDSGDCFTARAWHPDSPLPPRGAILVYRHPATGLEFNFRLIGLPGDRVQMRDGRLWLNGAELALEDMPDFTRQIEPGEYFRCPEDLRSGDTCRIPQYREILPGGASHAILDLGESVTDNTAEITVPEAHVFLLGDNRDNAADSRVPQSYGGPGLLAVETIWGVVQP